MPVLKTILLDDGHKHPLVILQSSLAQSALPILRHVTHQDLSSTKMRKVILFCLLYSPSTLWSESGRPNLQLHNWTERVPGYSDINSQAEMLNIVAESLSLAYTPLDEVC